MKEIKKILIDGFNKRKIDINFENDEALNWDIKRKMVFVFKFD